MNMPHCADSLLGPEPRWPVRLHDVGRELASGADGLRRDQLRSEVWLLLNTALLRYLRFHRVRQGYAEDADLEDISANKSLDLLRRLEEGKWTLAERSPTELTGFLSAVARNGLVDFLRKNERFTQPDEDTNPGWDVEGEGRKGAPAPVEHPALRLERQEFASALKECALKLDGRKRKIWYLRVFLELPSREIAVHPDVGLKSSHIDVLLQRAREAIRECLGRRGYRPQDMPSGVFADIWRSFHSDRA